MEDLTLLNINPSASLSYIQEVNGIYCNHSITEHRQEIFSKPMACLSTEDTLIMFLGYREILKSIEISACTKFSAKRLMIESFYSNYEVARQ